jgi:hypothetical protein
MANYLYPAAKQKFLSGELNWLTDPIVAVLVGTRAYTYSAAHVSMLDLPVEARIAASGTLTGRSATLGVVDADDASFGTVIGNPAQAVVLATDTGTDATSYLIAYLDQAGTTLPVNPDGSTITVRWSNGNSKIFCI